jgi:hypothetical protein
MTVEGKMSNNEKSRLEGEERKIEVKEKSDPKKYGTNMKSMMR